MTDEIRLATAGDVPDMTRLLGELFVIETDFVPDPRRQEAGLRALLDLPTARLWVAVSGKRVVGMVTVQTLISTAEGGAVGLIEDLIIDRSHRRRGLGRALLDAVVEWANATGLSRLQLLADRENLPALAFYRQADWAETKLVALRQLLNPDEPWTNPDS